MHPPELPRLLRFYLRHLPHGPGAVALAGYLDRYFQDHPVTTWSRTRHGLLHHVNTRDVIQRYLYLFGVWEPVITHEVTTRLSPGDTFIDIGAHTGYYSLLASRIVGSTGRVVAIEPVPAFHDALLGAAAVNESDNIRAINTAAAAVQGVISLFTPDSGNLGNTTMVRPRGETASVMVDSAPLSDLLMADEVTTARLIKIDVEGAEAAVVEGLAPLLGKLRADAELIIEVTPRSLQKLGTDPSHIDDVLTPAGFRPYVLANDYDPRAYPRLTGRPPPPTRLVELRSMTDVLYSRVQGPT